MRALAVVIIAGLTFLAVALPSRAEKRAALIIGNAGYSKVARLANPINDAKSIGDMFRRAGFDAVTVSFDLGKDEFDLALQKFEATAKDADIAAFYFSGHGIQIADQNYLLPVDAELIHDNDTQREAISLERVLRAASGARRLRLIILDACRDNPFAGALQNADNGDAIVTGPSAQRDVHVKSITKGLAPPAKLVETADTLIAFAARAGTQAVDGAPGTNSPFARALDKYLAQPGLDVRLALGKVRDEVRIDTGGRQEPYTYGSIGGGVVALVPESILSASPPAYSPARRKPEQDRCFSFNEKEYCQ